MLQPMDYQTMLCLQLKLEQNTQRHIA